LTTQARRFEKEIFLECNGREFSFAAVDDRTDRVATSLSRLGLRNGDRVALLMANRPEYIFFLLGVPKIGMIPVTIDDCWPREEIVAAVRESKASALVTESRFAGLRADLPSVTHWIVTDDESFGAPPFERLEAGRVLGFWPDLTPDDPALISYAGGPPGRRKAVVLTHRNLISSAFQVLQPFRIDGTDRFLCALPLSTTLSEVLLVVVPWVAGATCILRGLHPTASMAKAVQESRATFLAGTPLFYQQIAGSADLPGCDLSSLRLAVCTAGPAGDELYREFEQRHDALLVEGYGRVEATCLSCANPYTGVRRRRSLGLPLPGQECRILDQKGREVAPGTSGEIVVKGPNVMKCYDGDPAATSKAIRDGWLHTGDLGHVDADGYYYLDQPAAV
jgi:acyl-CoA synthetase (AMP-forming)/AMP-acid ligase II